ncbi:unnamed protein product [Rotaria magnacalcarata]
MPPLNNMKKAFYPMEQIRFVKVTEKYLTDLLLFFMSEKQYKNEFLLKLGYYHELPIPHQPARFLHVARETTFINGIGVIPKLAIM